MQSFVTFGSWKLRHDEAPERGERTLTLYPWPAAAGPLGVAPQLRLDAAVPAQVVRLSPDGGACRETASEYPDLLDALPLAIVFEQDGAYRISHALMRVEDHLAQFFRVTESADPGGELWRRIAELNDEQHLVLSNHECYYLKDRPDVELEQKLTLARPFSYTDLTAAFFAALDGGCVPGFLPQLGDELQFWSYDNHLFELASDETERGYVSVIEYCKKKSDWDQPMVMFKKKVFDEDSLERWERNYENQWVEDEYQDALESFFSYRLERLAPWRRTRCDVACESLRGNVFMVNFDTCQVHGDPSRHGRLQQCEIEYLKTRGVPQTDVVKADFERLVEAVEAFLAERGHAPRRTHYSKLTFLREHRERRADEPSAGR